MARLTWPPGRMLPVTLEDCRLMGAETRYPARWVAFCYFWLNRYPDWEVYAKKAGKTGTVYVTLHWWEGDALFRARVRFADHPIRYRESRLEFFVDSEGLQTFVIKKKIKKALKKWKRSRSQALVSVPITKENS